MSKPMMVNSISVPHTDNNSHSNMAGSTVHVGFTFNPQVDGMITYFENNQDISDFFNEIAEYACYKINRDLKAGRTYRNRE